MVSVNDLFCCLEEFLVLLVKLFYFLLLQISLKTCIVQGQRQWILSVSWLGSEERKTFTSLFNSLQKFLKGYFFVFLFFLGFCKECVLLFYFIFSKPCLSYRYDEAPVEYKPYRQKDGALLAIGALCDKLKQTEPYKSELERMLVQHVFPEFRSPVGHLRAKVSCIWISLYFIYKYQ